jgi:precorrin-6B methylase 2
VRRNLPLVLVGLAVVGTVIAYYEMKSHRTPDVPFVTTPTEVVDAMLELAEVKKDDLVYDLGCGDGRIVIAAAQKHGCRAIGFDIDPARVSESRANVDAAGVAHLVTIRRADIFDLDLSEANVVTMFLTRAVNAQLLPQLERLRPGTRIVSHMFSIPGIKPKKVMNVFAAVDQMEHRVYLWTVPLEKE